MTPVQKKILCALHADLLRSDTNCLWLVTLTKIFLGFPALSSPGLEATDSKGQFSTLFTVSMYIKEHGMFKISQDEKWNILCMP